MMLSCARDKRGLLAAADHLYKAFEEPAVGVVVIE